MKNKIKILLAIITPILMSGCASMNSDFDCPIKNGVRCQSLDEVNAAVDRGELGGSSATVDVSRPSYTNASYFQYKDSASSKYSKVRYPEDVMQVWIAPYEDTNGNYHQASSVYTVTRPGYWMGNPPKEIKGV